MLRRCLAGTLLTLVLLIGATAGADYLTKDGKLTATVLVRDVQGGAAGFTGKQITVKASGEWEESRVQGVQTRLSRKGTLNKKQLARLAEELKKYDPATLKDSGKPVANPRVVTVSYGSNTAELQMRGGSELPKEEAATVPGRFAGMLTAVRAATAVKE